MALTLNVTQSLIERAIEGLLDSGHITSGTSCADQPCGIIALEETQQYADAMALRAALKEYRESVTRANAIKSHEAQLEAQRNAAVQNQP